MGERDAESQNDSVAFGALNISNHPHFSNDLIALTSHPDLSVPQQTTVRASDPVSMANFCLEPHLVINLSYSLEIDQNHGSNLHGLGGTSASSVAMFFISCNPLIVVIFSLVHNDLVTAAARGLPDNMVG